MTDQLSLPFDALSLGDLRALLRGGLVVESGATEDGKVRSYSLTPMGRALLANQLARHEDDLPTRQP